MMANRQKISNKIGHHTAKSYTSIYDIFVQTHVNEADYWKHKQISNLQEILNDPHRKFSEIRESYTFDNNPYVTSEKYHALNKRSSDKSIVRSTSTLFYDLDNLAKRHSYHCGPEVKISTNNIVNLVQDCRNNGFDTKSGARIQEYTTDIPPTINAKDSVTIITKKVKKSSPNDSLISSEVYIKDSGYIGKNFKFNDKQQKFWSYAKYRTEYTKPIPEEKKIKKTDRGKRIEDPCPCQLFSYACPCTDNKSLTKLAGNSNTVTVANQMISAMRVSSCQKVKVKSDNAIILADKETSARTSDLQTEYEAAKIHEERLRHVPNQNGSSHTFNEIKPNNSCKYRCNKKPRQYLCPNCNEKVEVVTVCEQDENLKLNLSPVHRIQENSSPAQYSYVSNMSQKSKPIGDKDSCKHEPPCELVPVCQILPAEQVYSNSTKCCKGQKLKNTPRTIKVTKACRHHPPCTVAPSCQRLNVLKNNCEYIPPCLHRPRCINLPLCVPFSKTLDYDELLNKNVNEEDNIEYPVYTTPKYVPTYQPESLNNNLDHRHHFHTAHNTCEYVSEYEPRYFFTPNITCTSPTYSPYQMPSQMPCDFPKSNKSCQYECTSTKRNTMMASKESVSGDAIIYIRDVGCQFRNKHHSQDNSLIQSKMYHASYDEDQGKSSNFYSNYHTLRYEDKFTNPLSCGDHSMSTVSTSSIEIDIHCPSHGKDSKKNIDTKPVTGFEPRQSPVVANCVLDDPIIKLCISRSNNLNRKLHNKSRKYLHTHPVRSRNCFLKNKCKNVFSVRRRGKSRLSYQSILNLSSTKTSSHKNT